MKHYKLTKDNSSSILDEVSNNDIVKYKNISFQVDKDSNFTTLKLITYPLFYLILTVISIIIVIGTLNYLFIVFLNKVPYGFILLSVFLLILYLSKKTSLIFFKKIFKNQIDEFYDIIKHYKTNANDTKIFIDIKKPFFGWASNNK